MWLQWLPWRWLIKRVARHQGFLDPFALISSLERFAQPSEVAAPTELLRSGAVLHARGLINSQAIQHNLDWVWPYWVQRQFTPKDISFVPRAFSITHINLTHRNWTAVGQPDEKYLPIVDPRGLVTPFYDGWSIDGWIIEKEGKASLITSRARDAKQEITIGENVEIITSFEEKGMSLLTTAKVVEGQQIPIAEITYTVSSPTPAFFIMSLRPYNPEGVSFIHDISVLDDAPGFKVNGEYYVFLDTKPVKYLMSDYKRGDIYSSLKIASEQKNIKCSVGMATAAAVYELKPNTPFKIKISVPLRFAKDVSLPFDLTKRVSLKWKDELGKAAVLKVPDEKFQFLYDTAVATLILHSPDEVYPGPYTYKRFWFRDAAFILDAMLTIGFKERTRRVIGRFMRRQTPTGYFLSQEGEWDSNGEALWIIDRYCQVTQDVPPKSWLGAVDRGGLWISRKRLSSKGNSLHAGLFPPGFSAEHLGPNDYYYWDDFWGIAGLESATQLTERFGNKNRAKYFGREAKDLTECVEKSLSKVAKILGREIIPASPYRRMDAGAIGSLAGSYPLQALSPADPRLMNTINYLLNNCVVDGGFFQEMTHSGINPYLTLHMAQVLLRAGDGRYWALIKSVADLASPTGQWPEAIHPQTKGGCMGDGQHVWAAAEWIVMLKNLFVREEGQNTLILAGGIPQEWVKTGQEMALGKISTIFGTIEIKIKSDGKSSVDISWQARWHNKPPHIEIHLPGYKKVKVPEGVNTYKLTEV